MNLGLSMEQTLALLTATTAPPIVVQKPDISTPQPTINLTEPSIAPAENIPEVETGGERGTHEGGNAESDMNMETEEKVADRRRKLKKKVGEGPESVEEGMVGEVEENATGCAESESSKEMGNIGNLEANKDDYVIGYTKGTTLGDDGWESAISILEDTPEIRVERAFLNALPRFTGGKDESPWRVLSDFETLCWTRKQQVGVSDEIFQMATFPYCLAREALDWFMSIEPASFKQWLQVRSAFLNRYMDKEELEAPMEAWSGWNAAKANWEKDTYPNKGEMPTLKAEIKKLNEIKEHREAMETMWREAQRQVCGGILFTDPSFAVSWRIAMNHREWMRLQNLNLPMKPPTDHPVDADFMEGWKTAMSKRE